MENTIVGIIALFLIVYLLFDDHSSGKVLILLSSMNTSGWIQLILYIAALLLVTKPLGIYLFKVLDADGKTFLDPVVKPIERLTYKLFGIDPKEGARLEALHDRDADLQCCVNAVHLCSVAESGQAPALNPQKLAAVSPDIWPSIRRPASPRTPTGRLWRRKHDVLSSRRWWPW